MKKLLSILLTTIICFSSVISAFSLEKDLLGDADLDGKLTVLDATKIQCHLAQLITLSDKALAVADVSGDQEISIIDATMIQQYIALIIDEFPAQRTKVYDVKAVATSDSDISVSWEVIDGATKYWIYVNGELRLSTTTNSATVICKTSKIYEIKITAMLSNGRILKLEDADAVYVTMDKLPKPTEPSTESPTESPVIDLHEYAKKIEAVQNENTLTISLLSDVHYDEKSVFDSQKLENIEKMGELQNIVDVDMVANLGDFIVGNEDKETTLSSLKKLLKTTDNACDSPVLNVRGNHDDNGWYSQGGYGGTYQKDEMINAEEWYNLAIGSAGENFVTDKENPYGGYGYIDHEDSKIRVFMINSCDIPYILEDDGTTYRYNSYKCYAISNEQLNFVADALKFSDKENPQDWAALFLTHVPFDTTNDNGYRFGIQDALICGHQQLLSIISAYRKGTSYSFCGNTHNTSLGEIAEDFYVDIDVDYSKKGVGDVICFVSGHTHTDNASRKVGHENSLSHGYTYLSLIGSTSFETIVIDREKSIVKAFKYDEVRPQNEVALSNPGAIDGEQELKIDMTSGVWEVAFSQFRPSGENIYTGLSDLWGSGYYFSNSATLNTETLELSTATVNEANKYAITKAIPVKANTQYVIPDIGGSNILYYTYLGKYSGAVNNIVDFDKNKKLITAKNVDGYFVFAFHKRTYQNYENFYIKELSNGLTY